jgi:hypothetical protein
MKEKSIGNVSQLPRLEGWNLRDKWFKKPINHLQGFDK